MTNAKGGSQHPPLDPKVADELLTKLGTDDAFRASFSADPVATLARLGHAPAAQAIQREADGGARSIQAFGCMQVSTLASKEEFVAVRDQLQSHLTSTGTHTVVFCFEEGKMASSLRLK